MQWHSVGSPGAKEAEGEQKDVLPLREGYTQSQTAKVKTQSHCVDTGISMWLLWFAIRCTHTHGINAVLVCDPSSHS